MQRRNNHAKSTSRDHDRWRAGHRRFGLRVTSYGYVGASETNEASSSDRSGDRHAHELRQRIEHADTFYAERRGNVRDRIDYDASPREKGHYDVGSGKFRRTYG